ncbi:MAG: succinate dehydrogenase iron-sulfur subunit [Phycisphaerae bacterium]|nr:succinate dehydrogenase iron-sulfur subunit [Phycisphaerae bacterium]
MPVTESSIHVLRSDEKDSADPAFVSFAVPHEKDMTVLAALLWIQDNLDGTLALRYSCRGAVCGSCAMVINGDIALACRIHLRNLPAEVIVEPLPNLPIQKDLVVDMTRFWESWARVRPYLIRFDDMPEKEILQTPAQLDRIEQFINCMLCACCYSACPLQQRNPEYVGPAALAALARFENDSRDQRDRDSLKEVSHDSGMWGCRSIFRCIDVCPRNVRPADGIAELRTRALKDLLGRKKR